MTSDDIARKVLHIICVQRLDETRVFVNLAGTLRDTCMRGIDWRLVLWFSQELLSYLRLQDYVPTIQVIRVGNGRTYGIIGFKRFAEPCFAGPVAEVIMRGCDDILTKARNGYALACMQTSALGSLNSYAPAQYWSLIKAIEYLKGRFREYIEQG